MKKLTLTTLALTALALASTGAFAATVSTSTGDLVLGFDISDYGNPGDGAAYSNYDLEVDLGSSENFSATTKTEKLSLTGSDLEAAFGGSWSSYSDLTWGAEGVLSNGGSGAFVSTDNDANYNTLSALPATKNLIAAEQTGALNGATALGDNGAAAVIGTSSNAANKINGAYSTQIQGGLNKTLFDYSGAIFSLGETQFAGANGPDGSLELYSYTPAGGGTETPLGIFTLTGSGSTAELTYTGINEIPEPSTYALMAVSALGFLVWMGKRRSFVA
jgi:hypothetical protein